MQQQLEQQTSYKAKTLTHLLAFFKEEIQRGEEEINDTMQAEYDDYLLSGDCLCREIGHYCGSDCDHYLTAAEFESILESRSWGRAEEKIFRLEDILEAISKALE